MPAAWPVAADLSALLTAAGITPPSNTILTDYLEAAIEAWNGATDYHPFLSTGSDTTHVFDSPYAYPYRVYFDNGIVSFTSVTVNGVAKVHATDYWRRPANAALKGAPYQYIEFLYVPDVGAVEGRNLVSVIGKWGYSLTVPDDAWMAVMCYAASQVARDISQGRISGAQSLDIQEGDMTERRQSASASMEKAGKAWLMTFDGAVARYRRVASLV